METPETREKLAGAIKDLQTKGDTASIDKLVAEYKTKYKSNTRESRIEQGLPVGSGTRAEPTGAGNLVRGFIKPLAQVASSAQNISQIAKGQEGTDLKSNYFGSVPRIGKDFDITSMSKESVKGALGAAGTGLELASYLPVGSTVRTAGKAVAQPFKQAAKQTAKNLSIEGATGSGLANLGQQLQSTEKRSFGDRAKEFVGSTLAGGTIAPVLGVGAQSVSRAFSKLPTETVKKNVIEATSKALGTFKKKPAGMVLGQPEQQARGLANIQKYSPFNVKESDDIFDDTVRNFINAINNIFKTYNDIATEAGDSGVKVDTKTLKNSLSDVLSKGTDPQVSRASRILSEIDRIFPSGQASPVELQQYLQRLQPELKGVFSGSDNAGAVVVKEFVDTAKNELDTAVSRLGKEYQTFKDDYASLKAIEDSLVRQYQRALRQKGGGLADYAEMLSNGEMLAGIISANPALMAKSLAVRVGAKILKNSNDPASWLRKAFEGLQKEGVEFTPKARPRTPQLRLPAPRQGTPQQQVNVPMRMPTRRAIEQGTEIVPNPKPSLTLPKKN
jgi:hypothetical protein